jgi:hypothetical protein
MGRRIGQEVHEVVLIISIFECFQFNKESILNVSSHIIPREGGIKHQAAPGKELNCHRE